MPRFIALVDFTRQGMVAIDKTVERSELFRQKAAEIGAEVQHIYWTLGAHDGVLIFDAPDGSTATAVLLSLGKMGNITTQSMRAFDKGEIKEILEKTG